MFPDSDGGPIFAPGTLFIKLYVYDSYDFLKLFKGLPGLSSPLEAIVTWFFHPSLYSSLSVPPRMSNVSYMPIYIHRTVWSRV